MVLEPFVLVTIVDKVSKELPVTCGFFGAVEEDVVSAVAEIGQISKVADCIFNVN